MEIFVSFLKRNIVNVVIVVVVFISISQINKLFWASQSLLKERTTPSIILLEDAMISIYTFSNWPNTIDLNPGMEIINFNMSLIDSADSLSNIISGLGTHLE